MAQNEKLLRINKFLSECGVASRRGADELVLAGRVRLNGQVVCEPGVRVDLFSDQVQVDGSPVSHPAAGGSPGLDLTVVLHKPVQVVTTRSDPQGRQTVFDLLPEEYRHERLLHVGRLDYFSEGLLLLTTDGSLMNRLIHPRWHLPKVYHVLVRGQVSEIKLGIMRDGMVLKEGERLAPVQTSILRRDPGGVWLEMTLLQGLNRQIRRMCRDLGLTVLRLIRVRQGPIALGTLNPGQCRPLTPDEARGLRRAVGL
ncbi:ribosomal large subunit pseudouridine synthase B [Humidesulfovibrio mexicanus]|uniref:Pseudouridine synthase n=1 Tax=Humidesulfovibrio mexicanus TaxID=147047 RepID=A0A238XLB4_9BACT|nr:pseudouridine synthase [Humidesulfovibrio mexicanus]SNR59253.1 ribosomal large subunit pseudouridine synthase B [Humidesulfovibrio mexicanus]